MELVYNKFKFVVVIGMVFSTGDVNNFVVGSEEGIVYIVCRYGRWFFVFLLMTCFLFFKVCYYFLDYNYFVLWERYFGRNVKYSFKFLFFCRFICFGYYLFVNFYLWGKMLKFFSILYEIFDYLFFFSFSF